MNGKKELKSWELSIWWMVLVKLLDSLMIQPATVIKSAVRIELTSAKAPVTWIGITSPAFSNLSDKSPQTRRRILRSLPVITDLNPLRAGMVKRPEDYRWNSLGYHVQTSNRDNFLSTDFGLKEFNVKSEKDRIKKYRRYVYEAGAVNRPEKGKTKVIGDRILEKERNREFELSRSDRFRYRTRYFTDSGIIGSKEFVSTNLHRFKHLFYHDSISFFKSSIGTASPRCTASLPFRILSIT